MQAIASVSSFLALRGWSPSDHRGPVCPSPSPASAARLKAAAPPAASSFVHHLRRPITLVSLPRRSRTALQTTSAALLDRFDERAIAVVLLSQSEAAALGEWVVWNEHLLLGLIAEDISPSGFLDSGITLRRAREVMIRATSNVNARPPPDAHVPFSLSTIEVFEAAVDCCTNMRLHRLVNPEHIVIGLFEADDGNAAAVLERLGAKMEDLAWTAFRRLTEFAQYPVQPPGKLAMSNAREKSIARFCVDLTARARDGLIDPVIGRTKEIQRVTEILCRKRKNNPILLGHAGSRKTAIIEGLALYIVEGAVPLFSKEKCILSLDVGLLIAGTKLRGELEARVSSLIREIKNSGELILFIDEVHTLIDMGIADTLKPILGRERSQFIASTTLHEYKLRFEKDKTFARRFTPVLIDEPNEEETVKILLGIQQKYESHHNCKFTREAINAAVYLSVRYIRDGQLPDKAIDVIDEAGSKARLDAFQKKKKQIFVPKLPDFWQDIIDSHAMLEAILENRFRNYIDSKIREDMFSMESSQKCDEEIIVGAKDIAGVISLWTGIPVQRLKSDEKKILLGLEEELRKRVIGQDDAVSAVSRAMKRWGVGINSAKRPISVMLFCGPTGVGKTKLTKALAASCFGSEESMVRLDMSEYMQRNTVTKLIGSPLGYIGFGEGSTLTEAVRRKPFTVVLLDEIEKAHPDICNIFLQVFEDGHLTDSKGRRVSFRNTLIVMTSNVGSEAISKGKLSIEGFLLNQDRESNPKSYAAMEKLVLEELKAFFLPELLNRVDEVVVFRPLERAQMMDILSVMLEQVMRRLEPLKIRLEVSDAVRELVCQHGFNRSYGARHLRRALTELVEDVIAEAILSGEYKAGDSLVLDVDAAGHPTVGRLPDSMH